MGGVVGHGFRSFRRERNESPLCFKSLNNNRAKIKIHIPTGITKLQIDIVYSESVITHLPLSRVSLTQVIHYSTPLVQYADKIIHFSVQFSAVETRFIVTT